MNEWTTLCAKSLTELSLYLVVDLFLRSMKQHVAPWSAVDVTVLYAATTSSFMAGYNLTMQLHRDVTFLREEAYEEKGTGTEVRKGFKDQFETTLERQQSDMVALFVDDIVFINDLRVDAVELDMFVNNPQIFSMSLRLHPGVTFFYSGNSSSGVPPLHALSPNAFVWEWSGPESQGDWTFPISLDGNIFRKHEIFRLARDIEYHNPNTFEFNLVPVVNNMISEGAVAQPLMLCYQSPVLVNVPVNRVQQVHSNRFNSKGIQSFQDLNQRFLHEERLALLTFVDIKDLLNSVHINAGLKFDSLFPGKAYIPWNYLYVSMHSQASENLFDTSDNEACLDPIFVQGHHWFWSVRDSIQHRALSSSNYSSYVLMLNLLGDDDHSLRTFVNLQEDLIYSEMPALEAEYNFAMKKIIISDGTHRASILLHRNFVGIPLSKLRISFNFEAVQFVQRTIAQSTVVYYHSDGSASVELPYHGFSMATNVLLRGQRNTTHFVDVLLRYFNFEDMRVLEIGCGIGANLMTLAQRVNLAAAVGILESHARVETATNISRELMPWVDLLFYEQNNFYVGGATSQNDIMIVNSINFEDDDWNRLCETYLRRAHVTLLDSFDESNIEIGLQAVARCTDVSTSVEVITLSPEDAAALEQDKLYFIKNNDI